MFTYAVALQGRGNHDAVINALRAGASIAHFERLRAAYAYATAGGVYVFAQALRDVIPDWSEVDKRWMVSLDFGHTEPAALEYLAALDHSQVRIPFANDVLANNLLPATCFHPKTLVLDQMVLPNTPPMMIAIGSANLTVSGLRTGHEDVSIATWTRGRMSASARAQLAAMALQAVRMDDVWNGARRLDSRLLTDYAALRRRRRPQSEDANRRVQRIEEALTLPYSRIVEVTTATRLWVEIGRVNQNLGRDRPGNQIELQRGTRVFFGLNPGRVPPNTFLGSVEIRYGTNAPTKHMRFGDNSMEKLDLPIPGVEGPTTYEHSVLMFTRVGDAAFELSVGTPTRIARWKGESRTSGTLFRMNSGREWGVLR